MKFLKNKKGLFLVYMLIAALAGMSNFMEPANVLVATSIVLSLLVILAGDEMAVIYLMLALMPFFNSLNFGGLAAGFVIPLFAIFKMFMYPSYGKGSLGFFIVIFLMVWFLHDIQYLTFASTVFSLLVPYYIFYNICNKKFDKYDGYYAMWLVIATTLVALVSVFMVQGGNLDAFLHSSYAGEMRLGEAATDEGEKNQLGGAMGFTIFTMTIITLLVQMLLTRQYKLWKKLSILLLISTLFFITFLTVSRVYLLGLGTMIIILILHLLKSKSVYVLLTVFVGGLLLSIFAYLYMSDFWDTVMFNYLGRMEDDGGQSGTGVRGLIYLSCIEYLGENLECLLIGKGNGAYPLIGASMHELFSFSAHNIILDALMSFGIIGSLILIVIYRRAYKKESLRTNISWSLFRIMPFVVIFVMYQTGSPFLQDKTYPFLMFLILNIIHCTDGTMYDPEWCAEIGLKHKKI